MVFPLCNFGCQNIKIGTTIRMKAITIDANMLIAFNWDLPKEAMQA